jgi:hypothetical protein
MMQKHVDSRRNFHVSQLVHSRKNPCRSHENQRWDPGEFPRAQLVRPDSFFLTCGLDLSS